jgi:penicillin-binding protein 1A
MAIAHESMDIPQIAGLALHPVQVEERKRLAALRAANPERVTDEKRNGNQLPGKTRKVLERLSRDLLAISNRRDAPYGPNNRAEREGSKKKPSPG